MEQPVETIVEEQPTKTEKQLSEAKLLSQSPALAKPKKMVTCPECSKVMLEKNL